MYPGYEKENLSVIENSRSLTRIALSFGWSYLVRIIWSFAFGDEIHCLQHFHIGGILQLTRASDHGFVCARF
jgi:hypothetical protein